MSQFAFSVGRMYRQNHGGRPTPSPPIKTIKLRVFTYIYAVLVRTTSIMLNYFEVMHRQSTEDDQKSIDCSRNGHNFPTRLWITELVWGGGECVRGGWCLVRLPDQIVI